MKFCIDLADDWGKHIKAENLEIFECDDDETGDNDRIVFKTEAAAEKFLTEYSLRLSSLDNKNICKSKGIPFLKYNRRYLVLGLMGKKFMTKRHYKRNWKPGDLFNLTDQTFWWTVELVKIKHSKDEKGMFEYYFKEVEK